MNKLIKSKKMFIVIWAIITLLFIASLIGRGVVPSVYWNKASAAIEADETFQYNNDAQHYVSNCQRYLESPFYDHCWKEFEENVTALDKLIKSNNYDSPIPEEKKEYSKTNKSYYDSLYETLETRNKKTWDENKKYRKKASKIDYIMFIVNVVMGSIAGLITVFIVILLIISRRAKLVTGETK